MPHQSSHNHSEEFSLPWLGWEPLQHSRETGRSLNLQTNTGPFSAASPGRDDNVSAGYQAILVWFETA